MYVLPSHQTEMAAAVMRELQSDKFISQISLKGDCPQLDHTPMGLRGDDPPDPFTNIFMFYAGKTLEFPPPVIVASAPLGSCETLP